jgi:hypothetical protein
MTTIVGETRGSHTIFYNIRYFYAFMLVSLPYLTENSMFLEVLRLDIL